MPWCYTHQLGIICIAVGKNGKENMEGLKTMQLSTVVIML